MGGDEAMIVAGFGCRRECPPEDIAGALREAERRCGRTATVLAIPAFKRMGALVAPLGLPIVEIDDAELRAAQSDCVTFSALAERATGFASLAEAAALAGVQAAFPPPLEGGDGGAVKRRNFPDARNTLMPSPLPLREGLGEGFSRRHDMPAERGDRLPEKAEVPAEPLPRPLPQGEGRSNTMCVSGSPQGERGQAHLLQPRVTHGAATCALAAPA